MENIAVANILRVEGKTFEEREDALAVEEPLEIRMAFENDGIRHQKSVSITMRTPGDDEELTLGFLFTEGIISEWSQVKSFTSAPVRWREAKENVLVVELAEETEINL
jgi:FdhD protein